MADYTDLNGVEWGFAGGVLDAHATISPLSPKTYVGKETIDLPSLVVLGRPGLIREVDEFAEANKDIVGEAEANAANVKPKPKPKPEPKPHWLLWVALGYAAYRVIKQQTGGRNYRG